MKKKYDSVVLIHMGRLGDFVSSFVLINPLKRISNRVDIICKENYKEIVDNEDALFAISMEQACQNKYDLLIDLTSTSNTRAISTKIKANTKIGSYRSLFHKIRAHLLGTYTSSFKSRPFINIIKYYYPFAEAVGVKCDAAPVLKKLYVPGLEQLIGISGERPVIGIAVGATDPVRELPVQLVRQIIVYVESLGGASLLIGPREKALEIGLDYQSTYFREETISELIATLSQIDYLIGSNSGVLHLAVALGTKSLGIYGSYLSSMYGPTGKSVRFIERDLDCRPCANTVDCEYHVRCMNDIKFEDVKNKIDDALGLQVAQR